MEPFARTIDAAKKYVVSSTLERVDWNAELVRGDLGKAVQQLKRQSGKGLLVGGVKLPLALAELGLIDQYEFVVQPRLAGHGPTLFAGLSKRVDLKLVSRLEFGSGAVAIIVAVAGAAGLYTIVKPVVGEARPPATVWIGHFDGAAFPSGHVTQAVAFYGVLALVLSVRLSLRARAFLWTGAGFIAAAVGASRIYLGAHWLTDVLAGYALGVAWIALVMAVSLVLAPPGGGGRVFMAEPDPGSRVARPPRHAA